MNEFKCEIIKIADRVETLARMVENDNNLIEYFSEAHNYLEGDDASPVIIEYLCDYMKKAE